MVSISWIHLATDNMSPKESLVLSSRSLSPFGISASFERNAAQTGVNIQYQKSYFSPCGTEKNCIFSSRDKLPEMMQLLEDALQ